MIQLNVEISKPAVLDDIHIEPETGVPSTLVDLQAAKTEDDDDVPNLVVDDSDDEDEYVHRPVARNVHKQKETLDPVKQAQLDEAEVNPIDLSTLFMTTKAASSLDPSTMHQQLSKPMVHSQSMLGT